jgi:hypothetical protein
MSMAASHCQTNPPVRHVSMLYKLKKALLLLLPRGMRYGPPLEAFFAFEGPCPCCGGTTMRQVDVLWDSLVDAWDLAVHERSYINRQQGLHCQICDCNLRSMELAAWLLRHLRADGPLCQFVEQTPAPIALLEINEAGGLSKFLSRLSGHVLATYPNVDMQNLPYAPGSFDVIVHSDTLEHIRDPVQALSECRRVLRDGGVCAFTVPVVVDRLTRSTKDRIPSYHGAADTVTEDFRVHTEFGADVWKVVANAGFREYRLFTFEHPAALVHVGVN